MCTVCLLGFAVSNGACVACLSGCNFCSSEIAICLGCGTGTFLTLSGSCTACSPFCTVCNANGCITCYSGYYLTSSFTCAQNCQSPCATCSVTAPSTCLTCVAGYIVNPSSIQNCQPSVECSNNSTCSVCPFGFVLSAQKCVACDSNAQCSRCLATNITSCTSCFIGSYLSPVNSCLACPTGCATCLNKVSCLTCSSGFTAASTSISLTSQIVSCIQCQSPCATCLGSPVFCTTCVSSFFMSGNKCVTSFNFGFSIVLSANFTVFYSNYNSFLLQLSQSVGSSNTNTITLNSLVSGSVSTAGTVTVTTTDTTTATTQFNNLDNTLKAGNVGGMPISSYSVIVNGGSIDTASTTNLALILGISIPLGVLRTFLSNLSHCGHYLVHLLQKEDYQRARVEVVGQIISKRR